MKRLKRISSLLAVLIALCCLGLTVLADTTEPIDSDQKTSLTVRLQSLEDEVKVEEGAEITIYKVADMKQESGELQFTYTSAFAGCKEDLTKEIPADAVAAMAELAKKNNATGVKGTTDVYGRVTFSDLDQAVYLVTQMGSVTGFTTFAPFLSYLPDIEEGKWNYDIVASPKIVYSVTPGRKPTPTPTPTPNPNATPTLTPTPDLPQTGQLNWPIPVLFVSGLLFICAGLMMACMRKQHEDE